LLDDAAVLTCMSYVDLNPIRAGIAEFPEHSDYTSIQQRINSLSKKDKQEKVNQKKTVITETKKETNVIKKVLLMPLTKNDNNLSAIGFSTRDYLELVDWAGRAVRDNKRGSIPESAPSILNRLELDADTFLEHMKAPIEKQVHPKALGSIDKLKALAKNLKQKFIRNQSYSQKLYKA